jgi:hypothetical protein
MKQYLCHPDYPDIYPNVMSHVINVSSYAFTISRNSTADGFITWEDHVLIYRDVRLSMIDFRSQCYKTSEKQRTF